VLSLHVLQGPDRGKRFELPDNEPQLIGRSSEALPITDRSVSRRHAELTPDGSKWYVRDLESANGTYLNGERIVDRVQLKPGDQIRCGSTLLVFAIQPNAQKSSPIRVLGSDLLDATVERKTVVPDSYSDLSSDDSLILASPDPASAAVHHLRIIYEITAITSRTFERSEMLNRVMDLIFEEFGPDRGFILLQNDPSERPDPVVIRYRSVPRSVAEGEIPVSRTIVQHTLRKSEGILSSNAMHDDRFQSGDSVQRYGIRSAICVPIKAGERLFGVIHIDSSVANYSFTEEQLRLLSVIGMHTGLALTTCEAISSRVENERLAVMGETIASLSHSIKNILQGLRGGADAVELALTRNDLQLAREGWPIVARNLDRIFQLTMNMLAYSKTREPELELTNLHSIVDDCVELLQPQCDQRKVALVKDLDSAMPPVPLDPGAIHQALMNLLTNAVQAAPERKGVVSVRTVFDAAAHAAEVHVGDNGAGVAAEHRARIFDAFVSTKGQRGTGLGLAVARKIAREHGGDVILGPDVDEEGEKRRGALFIMRLPADVLRADASETAFPGDSGDTKWS